MRERTSDDDLVQDYKGLMEKCDMSTAVDNLNLSFTPECYRCCTEQTSVMEELQISTWISSRVPGSHLTSAEWPMSEKKRIGVAMFPTKEM